MTSTSPVTGDPSDNLAKRVFGETKIEDMNPEVAIAKIHALTELATTKRPEYRGIFEALELGAINEIKKKEFDEAERTKALLASDSNFEGPIN